MQEEDANVFFLEGPLFNYNNDDATSIPNAPWIGQFSARVEASKIQDIRSLNRRIVYHVTCTTRLRIFNVDQFELSPATNSTSASPWFPVLLMNMTHPLLCGADYDSYVMDYEPKTLNTSVNTDVGQVTSQANTVTNQHTSGSVNSTTNNFGVNLSRSSKGIGGGAHYDHSTMTEFRDENVDTHASDLSKQLSNSDSMTVKDWASYAKLGTSATIEQLVDKLPNPAYQMQKADIVSWIWSQEYPWDTLQLRPTDASLTIKTASVPASVATRLFGEDGSVFLPSHLSQMGLDFVCRATWIITPSNITSEPTLQMQMGGELWQASCESAHITYRNTPFFSGLNGGSDKVKPTFVSEPIPLEQLSLVPISQVGANNGGVIAFDSRDCVYETPRSFLITSKSNQLMVEASNLS